METSLGSTSSAAWHFCSGFTPFSTLPTSLLVSPRHHTHMRTPIDISGWPRDQPAAFSPSITAASPLSLKRLRPTSNTVKKYDDTTLTLPFHFTVANGLPLLLSSFFPVQIQAQADVYRSLLPGQYTSHNRLTPSPI